MSVRFLLAGILLLLLDLPESLAGQSLVWDATEANAVSPFDQDKLVHVFKARNSGKVAVTIKAVKTSCGCAIGRISNNVLNASESTELIMEIDMTKIGNDSVKFATVQTDEPGVGAYQLALSIRRPPLFDPDIPIIRLDSARIPVEKKITFTLSAEAPTNTKILRAISSDPESFEVTLEEESPGDSSRTVTLTALKANPRSRKPINLIVECKGRIINTRAEVVCAAR